MLPDNDSAVDKNLTTVHILLDSNFAQRKEFWPVHSLLCDNISQMATTTYWTTKR